MENKTMTKSTITREESIQAVFDLKVGYTLGLADIEILKRVARMALAALDSEPVAYTDERNLGYIDRGRETAYLWGKQNSEASDVALYRHAQPAQVVPEEATPDSIEILASGRCRDHVVYQWDEDQRNAAADSWNACRAAMLEADPQLPGSDSAPVPGSWIPVSERMPERGDYLVTDGCDFDVQLFNGEQFIPGFVWEDKITHWMPLPAAPKEVK
ncbi:DUF551 domain-containing protein [Klebsiella pneumoniae]|uniref:DUF551 domain-containing protein n=1 Tax=Klebsiella pneumoniae TaxID=573 RepID=UPI0035A22BDE